MSYQIDYTQASDTAHTNKTHSFRTFLLTMTVFTIFLAGVHTYFPQGWDVLQDILLPGNTEVTRQAFDLLVENLRSGLPFLEAAQAFCAEIIAHANIP